MSLNRTDVFRWVCVRCGQHYSSENMNMRYRVALHIADSSTMCTTTVFGQNMDAYFGTSAADFCRLDNDAFDLWLYIFTAYNIILSLFGNE